MVETVANPAEQADAVEAQIAIKTLLKACEDARKDCKDPVLAFGRKIDGQAKEFCKPLEAELERISAKVRDYVAAQETRRRAEEALRLKELDELGRRTQEMLAKAQTIEEVDRIQERMNEEVRQASVPIEPVRAPGQIVREDWEITILDIGALWKAHPNCVRMEALLLPIKELLNAGLTPPGISARKVVNSTVRVGRRAEPLRIGQ